jgi:hypothetical protein
MKKMFALQPFSPVTLDLKITGEISRTLQELRISYQLAGDLSQVLIPSLTAHPGRQFELWEATCLEFFLAPVGEQHYWEFNMSPNGDWNVFRLDDYRQGLRNEVAVKSLPMKIEQQIDLITLDLQFDLDLLVLKNQFLAVAVTTVIQDKNNDFSYWALQHTGQAADFHQRADFVMEIP